MYPMPRFSPSPRAAIMSLALLTVGLFGGCATAPKNTGSKVTAAAAPNGRVLKPEEYELVTVTGSLIPVLVPKSDTVRPISSAASDIQTMSPEQFRDLVSRGQSVRR
jgi:hypothetical protein